MKRVHFIAALLIGFTAFSCGNKSSNSASSDSATTAAYEDSVSAAMQNDSAFAQEHSAQTALDYEGTYEGTTPCADCPGIKTVVSINKDKSFTYEMTYLERDVKPVIDKGTWTINGSYITLNYTNKNTRPRKIFVGENYIQLLDGDGNKITGSLEKAYMLTKVK